MANAGSALGVVIKLGTVAPEGSPWHESMLEVAQKWREISKGEVEIRIYAGGVAGDEKDMLRKIRIGQLHATALTSSNLQELLPEIQAVALPRLIHTDEELDHVMTKLAPRFEKTLEKNGFKVLTWSTAGWVRFFTKEPVTSPKDMRKRKLFFWGSDAEYVELLNKWGFNPVPLAVTDLLPSLQTGLVDSFPAPPAAALSFQWFKLSPNMVDLRWQPMPGATVVTLRQWNKIPEEIRPALEAVAREAGTQLQKEILQLEEDAITAMKRHGLRVHPISAALKEEWSSLARKDMYPVFVGSRFPKDVFDAVEDILDEYRRSHTGF
jgi:TRAP-type C4-dicarboxylate transport system substrate-binding protein